MGFFRQLWQVIKVKYKNKEMPAEYASAYKKLAPLYDTPFAEIRKRHIQNVIDNLNVGHSSNDITNRIYTHKTIRQLIDAINLI